MSKSFMMGQNRFLMLLVARIAGVDNMNQKIHMLAFFQGRLKTGHQLCRQILDKTHSISQSYLEIPTPNGYSLVVASQSRKELVSLILGLTGQGIHDS